MAASKRGHKRAPAPARTRQGRQIEPGHPEGDDARIACVDIPALPLQLLLNANPHWRSEAVAVVDDDSPQGRLLWVNAAARAQRILPGMRYAAARSLVATLRARVVPHIQVEQAVGQIFAALHDYSPRVEPDPQSPGVFHLDPSGLRRLYGTFEQWSVHVLSTLRARGLRSTVVVGFHRFRCQAIARVFQGSCVLATPRREASMAATVPLDRLDISPLLRDELSALGVHTLGDFMALPPAELRLRYGEEAEQLHRQATAEQWDPLRPRELVDPVRTTLNFEPPEANHERLLFRIKAPLETLVTRLGDQGQALSALRFELSLDHAGLHREQLEPAAPTLDTMQVLELIRLRLASVKLAAPIEAMTLDVEGVAADQRQLQLFEMQRRRDLEAGGRAIARLRAMFGADAVTHGRAIAAHLPEASYAWEATARLRLPELPPAVDDPDRALPPLARRLFAKPIPIPGPQRVRLEGWTLPPHGTVTALHGPFRVSGGWWVRTVERDYYYAETQAGTVLWIFYDRPRRRWFMHGEVD